MLFSRHICFPNSTIAKYLVSFVFCFAVPLLHSQLPHYHNKAAKPVVSTEAFSMYFHVSTPLKTKSNKQTNNSICRYNEILLSLAQAIWPHLSFHAAKSFFDRHFPLSRRIFLPYNPLQSRIARFSSYKSKHTQKKIGQFSLVSSLLFAFSDISILDFTDNSFSFFSIPNHRSPVN